MRYCYHYAACFYRIANFVEIEIDYSCDWEAGEKGWIFVQGNESTQASVFSQKTWNRKYLPRGDTNTLSIIITVIMKQQ